MHESHLPPETPCSIFDAQLNRALDGEFTIEVLAHDPHLIACAECRSSLAAVQLLLEGLDAQPQILPPLGFAERVVPLVVAERAQKQERDWTIKVLVGSLAASIALAVSVAAPWRGSSTTSDTAIAKAVPTQKVPSVNQSFADAGTALASLTKRAANQTIAPAKNLFAFAEKKPAETVPMPRTAEIAPVATSTIQPITDTTKRAINLFIRDVSSLASIQNKMKS